MSKATYRSSADDTSRRRAFVLSDLVYPKTVSHFDKLMQSRCAEDPEVRPTPRCRTRPLKTTEPETPANC